MKLHARACVCVCVCVFFPFILDIKFVGHTSRGYTRGRSNRIFHPPSFCGAWLHFSGEKDSGSPLVGHLFFYFLVRKIPLTGIELTSQRVRRLRGYL